MRRRAEHVDATRQRIVEATVRLHTTVGPANASIAAIALEADVTRLTVYRHFADAEELFSACMAHYAALHPRPDPAGWTAVPDLGERALIALGGLYSWYADHGADLQPVVRDIALWPAGAVERERGRQQAYVESIVGDADDGPRLRAVVGHVYSVWTWRSLVIEQGLSTKDAVELAVGWVVGAGAPGDTRHRTSMLSGG
jgi:AcrR family transcriptional regulator